MKRFLFCANCLTRPKEEDVNRAFRLNQELICKECLSTDFTHYPTKLLKRKKKE